MLLQYDQLTRIWKNMDKEDTCWHMTETRRSNIEERLYFAFFHEHDKCVLYMIQNHAQYIAKSTSYTCRITVPEWLIRKHKYLFLRDLLRAGLKLKECPCNARNAVRDKNIQGAQLLHAAGLLPKSGYEVGDLEACGIVQEDDSEKLSLQVMCRKTIRYQLLVQADNENLITAVQKLPLPSKIKTQLAGPILSEISKSTD